jgi:hypothetical protein
MHEDREEPRRVDPGEGDDRDTSLILVYLSNKLEPEAARDVEARARQDKDFRRRMADLVLLKGLVALALERSPLPATRLCRDVRRSFIAYSAGRADRAKTARLSRHLEECFECEVAYDRFQEQREAPPARARPAMGVISLISFLLQPIGIALGCTWGRRPRARRRPSR